ncbi:MAG: methionyl-tRNA formyltransferase [Candidatus Eremiobacter antarcticus]|nr:methionyl-tRNA formyltransferase [Candidatus Eremiobacteraeota bacterium]MBC5808627.1 methionyl-tRNA formyltransferase [Candidatus Eremiobacteraeota bacterium]
MSARRLRAAYFGSSDFSVPSLEALAREHDIVAVCSQPDKPAGRRLRLTATPVSALAHERGWPLFKPVSIDREFVSMLAARNIDLLACASYGKILPASCLSVPKLAALNVHPSMLPRYRGATPIQSAVRDGCESTGVTVFWMTTQMDAGDIAAAIGVPIEPADNFGSLHDKLAVIGAQLLLESAGALADDRLPRMPQDEAGATYTKPLRKEDLRLRFDQPARAAVDQVRSLSPRPGAWMPFGEKRLKVLAAETLERLPEKAPGGQGFEAKPGTIVSDEQRGIFVATAPGAILLTSVLLEGKAAMSGRELARGSRAQA